MRVAVLAAHYVVAGVLLALVVYPFWESYDYHVVRNEARTITTAGLVGRYLYATTIAWLCTGPLAYAVVERLRPDWPLASRVAWSTVVAVAVMIAVAFLMGTNLLFPDRVHRPAFVKWMDLFLAEWHFLAFIGYGVLLSLAGIATQWALRRG